MFFTVLLSIVLAIERFYEWLIIVEHNQIKIITSSVNLNIYYNWLPPSLRCRANSAWVHLFTGIDCRFNLSYSPNTTPCPESAPALHQIENKSLCFGTVRGACIIFTFFKVKLAEDTILRSHPMLRRGWDDIMPVKQNRQKLTSHGIWGVRYFFPHDKMRRQLKEC